MARRIDPEMKAGALADLYTGSGVREVARKYGLDPGTVSRWARAAGIRQPERGVIRAGEIAVLPTRKQGAESNTSTATTIEDKLLAYLHASLDALTAQARLFAHPEWLVRQSAKDLALLHGVHHDKVVRLL